MKISLKSVLRFSFLLLVATVFHSPVAFAKVMRKKAKKPTETAKLSTVLGANFNSVSGAQRIERATTLEGLGLWNLALTERLAFLKENSSSAELSRAANAAIVLDRGAELSTLKLDNSPAVRVGLGLSKIKQGQLAETISQWPSPNELERLEPEAKFFAFMMSSKFDVFNNRLENASKVLEPVLSGTPFDHGRIRLQRARIFFEQGKRSWALEELLNLPRTSPSWYSGMMVGAWSAYHLKDYNLALGLLMSVQSPYLASRFNPESFILLADTYFRLCHYESASRTLAALKARYSTMSRSLESLSRATGSGRELISKVLNYARGNESSTGSIAQEEWDVIMDGLLNDEAIADLDRRLTQIDFESAVLRDYLNLPSASAHSKILVALKKRLTREGTRLVASRLRQMITETKDALEDSLAIEIEIKTRLRERIIAGKLPRASTVDFETAVEKGFEFWPFQGEYWKDETGSYLFATSDVCSEEGAG